MIINYNIYSVFIFIIFLYLIYLIRFLYYNQYIILFVSYRVLDSDIRKICKRISLFFQLFLFEILTDYLIVMLITLHINITHTVISLQYCKKSLRIILYALLNFNLFISLKIILYSK